MPTIYIDMDAVVADWDAAATKILGHKNPTNGRWPDGDWAKLRDVPHFYRDLPLMPQAQDMMTLARRFRDDLGWDLYMLTAIPHDNDVPDAFWDKVLWQQEHFPDVIVRFGPYSTDKQDHCKPGDILVDDRTDNCIQWEARGGIAVQVKPDGYKDALRQLQKIIDDKMSLRRLAVLGV